MINYLAKHFIKDYDNASSPRVRQACGVLCGAAGICFNVLLFAGKFLVGLISNSIAITADAFNNLSDAGSSVITLVGFKMAGQKPDPHHPFGHGRIEYLSGLFVSIAILIMAFELLRTSVGKIRHPEEVAFNGILVVILLVSILVKLYMAYYNHRIGTHISSAAMGSTATDSLSDALATTVVLIATLVNHYTGLMIDGWCGVLVGFFILFAGINAARDTISPLLGQPPSQEFVHRVEAIVTSYEQVLGLHDLVVHDYGPGRIMLSVHAEVPAGGDIVALHDMIDNIEHRLADELHCEAVIHMDPISNNDEETNELKSRVNVLVKALGPTISFHDFRIVRGPTHTNIIFDVVIPYQFPKSDEAVVEYLKDAIHKMDGSFYAVIQVDKDYVQ